jgi:hypothetical protein
LNGEAVKVADVEIVEYGVRVVSYGRRTRKIVAWVAGPEQVATSSSAVRMRKEYPLDLNSLLPVTKQETFPFVLVGWILVECFS